MRVERICCDCKKPLGLTDRDDYDNPRPTHGYCDDCLKRAFKEAGIEMPEAA